MHKVIYRIRNADVRANHKTKCIQRRRYQFWNIESAHSWNPNSNIPKTTCEYTKETTDSERFELLLSCSLSLFPFFWWLSPHMNGFIDIRFSSFSTDTWQKTIKFYAEDNIKAINYTGFCMQKCLLPVYSIAINKSERYPK